MGTSETFGGSNSGLVPSWLDEPPASPAAAPDDSGGGNRDLGAGGDGDAEPYPQIRVVQTNSGLRAARSNVTRGARTSDAGAIQRGAGQYVSAIGGGRAAAQRMSNSRAVAGGIAGLARSFATQGPVGTLRQFNLEDMAGAPAEDVFVALTDMLCPAGGTIDEAIARDAMLETIADLAVSGVGDFDELSTDDLYELFIGVVSRSIEGKILNEVGTNAVSVPADIVGVEQAQSMLHDFVDRCVRDEFDALEGNLADLRGDTIDSFVDSLYVAALDLVRVLGEAA